MRYTKAAREIREKARLPGPQVALVVRVLGRLADALSGEEGVEARELGLGVADLEGGFVHGDRMERQPQCSASSVKLRSWGCERCFLN